MNRFFQLFSVAALFAMVATAGSVTFNTNTSTLTFNGHTGTSITYANGDVLTYVPTAVNGAVPSGYNFGELVLSCVGGGTSCGADDLTGTVLALVFTQTIPSNGVGTITSTTITGTITGTTTSQNAKVTWNNPSVTIGSVSYLVTNSPLNLIPAAQQTPAGPGVTTIQGFVTTPEPGSMLLLSTGLAGLFLARRRRS